VKRANRILIHYRLTNKQRAMLRNRKSPKTFTNRRETDNNLIDKSAMHELDFRIKLFIS
jgi:hypothetical protein